MYFEEGKYDKGAFGEVGSASREVWGLGEEEGEEESEEEEEKDESDEDWSNDEEEDPQKVKERRARDNRIYFDVPLPLLQQMVPFVGFPKKVRKRLFSLCFRTGGEGTYCFERWGMFEMLQRNGFDLLSSRFLGDGGEEGRGAGGVKWGRGEVWKWVREVGGGRGVEFYLRELGGGEGGGCVMPLWEGEFGGREEEEVKRAVRWEGKGEGEREKGRERRRKTCIWGQGGEGERERVREEALRVIKERLGDENWERRVEGLRGLRFLLEKEREKKEGEQDTWGQEEKWSQEEREENKKKKREQITSLLKQRYSNVLATISCMSDDPSNIVRREIFCFLSKFSSIFDFGRWAEIFVGMGIKGEGGWEAKEGMEVLNGEGWFSYFLPFPFFLFLTPLLLRTLPPLHPRHQNFP